jgi:hypothetical protein
MRVQNRFLILALAAGVLTVTAPAADETKKDKGTVVTLDDVQARAPASWKAERPANRMRFAQFRLPKQGDDARDAELIIFKGLGGSAKANVDRWKAQFLAPKGKTIAEVSKVQETKIGGMKATRLDIHGTYKFKARPFDPSAREERRAHYRMIAIQVEGPRDYYQIKLVGPDKTVEHYTKGFDQWLKDFKKD